MSSYVLYWDRHIDLNPSQSMTIRESEDAKEIVKGDILYVLTAGRDTNLLARLGVNHCMADPDREAILVDLNNLETAFFFRKHNDAVPVILSPSIRVGTSREAAKITDEFASSLTGLCDGTSDFSSRIQPPLWPGIQHRVNRHVIRAIRDGDNRPGIEIATTFLRAHYVTSELPGPSPVYVNAARQALFPTQAHLEGTLKKGKRGRINLRTRALLTDDALNTGINDDVSMSFVTPPDRQRHQSILRLLRDRLRELGLDPKYDGFIDCVVETPKCDLYFEVKSGNPGSLRHQIYIGTGQLLYYIWLDSKQLEKPIRGYLVLENGRNRLNEFVDFAESLSIRLIWSNDINSIDIKDLQI